MVPSSPSMKLLEFSVNSANHPERIYLDIDNQCLWFDDRPCELQPKAFQVLHYLANHAQEVLSHKELYEHLWSNTHVDLDNLKKYIRELRRTLRDDAQKPKFIETLSRRGYRFLPAVRAVTQALTEKKANLAETATFLVERDEQLDKLKQHFIRSAAGERQVVFMTGAPGTGKSALIAAFLAWIKPQAIGIRSSVVPCFKKEGRYRPDFSSLVNLLEDLCEEDLTGTTARSLEEHAPSWIPHLSPFLFHRHQLPSKPEGSAVEDPTTMIREAIRGLEFLAKNVSLVLIFEDMQWSDSGTIDFLNALARRDHRAKILVLVTFRQSFPDGSDVPLRSLKRDLAYHELCAHLHLDPLTRDGIGLYLMQLKGVRPPDVLVDFLYENSGGNPFLMRTFLESLFEQRLCSMDNGEWSVELERRQYSMPNRIDQFMKIELDALSPSDLAILEAGSVIGNRFCAEEIAAMLEQDCESVHERLAQFSQSGEFLCCSKDAPGYYCFTAQSLCEIVYQRMFHEHRKEMHRRFAVWLEASTASLDPQVSNLLAEHYQKAQEWSRAVPYVLLSTADAGRASAVEEALKLLSRGKEPLLL